METYLFLLVICYNFVTICEVICMDKPIIGIVCKHRKSDMNSLRSDSRIRDEIKQAIFDNGGIAIGIILPNEGINLVKKLEECSYDELLKEDIISQISLCDGIILQGGNASEIGEMFIAEYCYNEDIPVLGICAGQNQIVRALGGTLCKVDDVSKHLQIHSEYVHKCYINPTSKFYNIVGTTEMMVNSRHTKRVKTCPNLNIVGLCDDGYADVVEDPNKKFYIGVRFHPESLYKKDKNMNNIFVSFLEAARLKK